MSGEFQQQLFPENVPLSFVNGYQRQNNYIVGLETGLDTTNPFDDGAGTITVPAGGQVEFNGVIFKLTADIVLAKPGPNIAYWLKVVDNGDATASLELVTRPGVWDSAKNGCYIINGTESYRTLNWVSLGEIDNLTEGAIISESVTENTIEVFDFNFPKSWAYLQFVGGVGVDYIQNSIFFNEGKITLSLGNGGSCAIYELGN